MKKESEQLYLDQLQEIVSVAETPEARGRVDALCHHVGDRLDGKLYVKDGWDLIEVDTAEQAKSELMFWLLRNAWEAGAYCSPSWGRNFSEQVAVFLDTGVWRTIAEDIGAYSDAIQAIKEKYRVFVKAQHKMRTEGVS